MNLTHYYGSHGDYLKEHKVYFTDQQLQKEINFLIDVLKLKKTDAILDLACGHGRHAIELKKRGYNNIEGLDFSNHLLSLARKHAEKEDLNIKFYKQDINVFRLPKHYDKVFLFFSEFGLFQAKKILQNVHRSLKTHGLFLLDFDSIFRLIGYLKERPKSPYLFDCVRMKLKEKGRDKKGVRYYTPPELISLFEQSGFKIISIFGGYQKEPFIIQSKRMIVVTEREKK